MMSTFACSACLAAVGLWPPSRASSWPPPSSPARSSKPPTCMSPIQICGTVRRPERRIISSRCSGSASTSISVQLWPFARSNAFAWSQYGHQDLVYITISAIGPPRRRRVTGAASHAKRNASPESALPARSPAGPASAAGPDGARSSLRSARAARRSRAKPKPRPEATRPLQRLGDRQVFPEQLQEGADEEGQEAHQQHGRGEDPERLDAHHARHLAEERPEGVARLHQRSGAAEAPVAA